MRFFVSCFGGAADPTAATKSAVPPPSRTLRRKPQWKPSLGSISEDAAPPHRERNATADSAGDVKKSENSATTNSHRRHFSESIDYGYCCWPFYVNFSLLRSCVDKVFIISIKKWNKIRGEFPILGIGYNRKRRETQNVDFFFFFFLLLRKLTSKIINNFGDVDHCISSFTLIYNM